MLNRAIRRASDLTRRGQVLTQGPEDEEAMIAAREGVALWRSLVVAEDGHTGQLAGALFGLGVQLACVGDLDEAAEVSREAIRVCRRGSNRMRKVDPARFARALFSLGAWLGDDDHPLQAIAATEASLAVWRRLERRDGAHGADIADALRRLARYLMAVGRDDAAATAAQEAVQRYRPLVRADPSRGPELTEALVLLQRSSGSGGGLS